MKYEICYLIGESKELDLESIKKGVEEIVIKEGGVFLEGEFQEKRKMAYEIKKEIRGAYVAKRFEVANKDKREAKVYPGKDIVSEITKKMNLNNDILRFVIVKADDLPELNQKTQEVKEDAKEEKTEKKMEVKKQEIKKKEKKEVKKEEKEEKKEAKKEEKKEAKKEAKKEVEKEEKEVKKEVKKNKEESVEDFDKKLDEIIKI